MFGTPSPKYRGIGKDFDDVPLYFHLLPDGPPVRKGDTPGIVDKNLQNAAEVTLYARSEYFRIPEDLERYTKILDWIANGMGVKYAEEKRPHGEAGFVSWLTWFDVRGVIPKPGHSLVPDNVPTLHQNAATPNRG